jgi:uncharacterized protein (TIGR03067 family)
MKGRTSAVVVALTLTLGAAGCATDAAPPLDGDWAGVQVLRADKPDAVLSGHIIRFEGDRFTITRNGKRLFGGRYAIDPAAAPPEIDFHQTASKDLKGTWRGIYRLDGDRLTICDNAYGMAKPRPKSFEDCAAPGYVLFRFTRAK